MSNSMSSIWNFTVSAASPMFFYSSFTGNSSTGWATVCNSASPRRCDEHTAHLTSVASTVSLSFNGTGILLYGNATSADVIVELEDGSKSQLATDASTQLLGGFSGLDQTNHTVTLSVQPLYGTSPVSSNPLSSVYFAEAVVSFDTGIPSVNVTSEYVDDMSAAVDYGSYWYEYTSYEGTVIPPTIINNTFHASNTISGAASLRFNASAIFVYGPCYESTGAYVVALNPPDVQVELNTTTPPEDLPILVIENCLRYFATGLDPTVEREVSLQSTQDQAWVTLDYVQLVSFSPSFAVSSNNSAGSSGSSSSSSSSTPVGPIIGGVVGGVVFVVLVGLILFCFCRRKAKAKAAVTPFQPRLSLVEAGESEDKGPFTPPATSPAISSVPPSASEPGSNSVVSVSPASGFAGTTPMTGKARLLASRNASQSTSPVTTTSTSAGTGPAPPTSTTTNPPSSTIQDTSPTPATPSPPAVPSLSPETGTRLLPQPPTPSAASPRSEPPTSPSLSQIATDVNRILAQLSSLGRPTALGDDEDGLDAQEYGPDHAPPSYGESSV